MSLIWYHGGGGGTWLHQYLNHHVIIYVLASGMDALCGVCIKKSAVWVVFDVWVVFGVWAWDMCH